MDKRLTTEEVREQFASVAYSGAWYDSYIIMFDRWFASEIEKAFQRGRESRSQPIADVTFSTYGWACSTAAEHREGN